MSEFRRIALQDLEEALFNMQHKRYRSAVFFFQQFAEKSAKALLEKKDSESRLLKSHAAESILAAYDEQHKVSDLGDKARYLTSFYFNTRYPGDNYAEVVEEQVIKAHKFAMELDDYFVSELELLNQQVNAEKIEI